VSPRIALVGDPRRPLRAGRRSIPFRAHERNRHVAHRLLAQLNAITIDGNRDFLVAQAIIICLLGS
jgi:hypothetical protein